MKAKAIEVAAKAKAALTKKAGKVAKIEHVLCGAVAVGVVSGVHMIEIVASGALIAVEALAVFAATEAAEVA